MSNFLEDIISPTTIKAMHSLGNNWDTFNLGLKQLLNFQFMMFDAMNDLAAKYRALQTEVNSISHQVFNIDEAVQAYFDRNPVQVMTRDGVNLDDALASVPEKLNTLSTHVTNTEETQTEETAERTKTEEKLERAESGELETSGNNGIKYSGTCGDCSWTIDENGLLTVSGEGDLDW